MSKTPIDILLDQVEYKPTNAEPNAEGIPYVTHEGILNFADISITVLVLNTGQRIIPKDQVEKFFGEQIVN